MRASHTQAPAHDLRRSLLVLGLLALLIVLAYGNSVTNPFIYADHVLVETNRYIQRLDFIPSLFVVDWFDGTDQPMGEKRYRPLASVSLALNYALGGLQPAGYHLVNLALHLAMAWLLYRFALQIGLSPLPAALSAALFAVHPLHTEAVTVVSHRTEVMMALGVVGGLLLAARGHLGWSLAAFAAGLLSKEQAVVLPALVVLYDVCMRDCSSPPLPFTQRIRPLALRYGAYGLVLVAYLTLRLAVFGSMHLPHASFLLNPVEHAAGLPKLLTIIKATGHYLWLWVWPARLAAGDYSYNAIPLVTSVSDPGLWWGLASWGSLFGLAVWGFRREPRATFCVGLTALAVLPASNLILPAGFPLAERVFYLSSAGLCLLVGLGAEALVRQGVGQPVRAVTAGLLAIICLMFAWRTSQRNEDWTSGERLFRSAATAYPTNAKAHALLGDYLQSKPDPQAWAEAARAYEEAMRIYPDFPNVDVLFASNLATLYLKLQRPAEAIAVLEQTVRRSPRAGQAWFTLGQTYRLQGEAAKAESAWRMAVTIHPGRADYHNILSRFFIEEARFDEALTEAETAMQLDPKLILAQYNRALALEGLGRLREADLQYDRVLSLGPPAHARNEILARQQALKSRLGAAGQSETPRTQPRAPQNCPPGLSRC